MIRLRYELRGEGPTLVLLNGLFQRLEVWNPLLPWLEGFRILRYDMRGQGGSEAPPGPYPPQVHAQDLQELLEVLGIERYRIVGHSNGGVVAQSFALQEPKGLEALVLLCTTPWLDPLLRAKVQSWAWAFRQGGTRGRVEIMLPWTWGRAYLEAHPDRESLLQSMEAQAPSLEAQEALLEGFLAMPDFRPELGRLKVPTLVISAEDDLLFPPHYGAELAQRIPGAQFERLPGLGHSVLAEGASQLAPLLHSFFDALTGPKEG